MAKAERPTAQPRGAGLVRMCIGCRRRRPPSELVRMVLGPGGDILVGRHAPGRGAWLCCDQPRCFELAARRRAFARALRHPVDEVALTAVRQSLFAAARCGVRDYGVARAIEVGARHETTKG